MEFSPSIIDGIRAAHLVCFAAGMGTGIYFDFHMLRKFNDPIGPNVIEDLGHLHRWIISAFAGLWLTGIALIYIRTGFDTSAFSPKLWLKLGCMALLVVNSVLIVRVVLPALAANLGRSIAGLSARRLMAVSQIAITSMYCWTAGLLLGSSAVLKSANWDVLLPLAFGWFLLLTTGGQVAIATLRRRMPLPGEGNI